MVEESLPQFLESLRIVTHVASQRPRSRLLVQRLTGAKPLNHAGSALLAAVDELDIGTDKLGDRGLKQRIMRAAENNHPRIEMHERRQIVGNDRPGDRIVRTPPFLDNRYEKRTGPLQDGRPGIVLLHGLAIGV